MRKLLLMVFAAIMAISAFAEEEIVKKVRVYERGNLVYENYYNSVDSIVFVDIIQNPEFSQCYAWGVQGTLDDPNSPVRLMVDAIHNDISDAELTALGMTIYTGVVYNGTLASLDWGFLVVLSKELPAVLRDALGINISSNPNNWWDYGTITRGSVVYHVYIFPNDYEGDNASYGSLTLNP